MNHPIEKIRTLQLFHEYLNTTENWAFHLIDKMPEIEVVVASKRFLPCNFYPKKFSYLEFPIKKIDRHIRHPVVNAANRMISIVLTLLYPRYVGRFCGHCHLVHSHFAMVGWQYMATAERLGIPHVVSLYGVDYESIPYQQPVWKKRYRELFQRADLFLCEGDYGKATLVKTGCPAEKIRVAPLGIGVGNIPFIQRTKRPNRLDLLQVATFIDKKGHRDTIASFRVALRECPEMTLTLLGPDYKGLKQRLQEESADLVSRGRLAFLDSIEFSQLHLFMKDYHVFIQPSRYADDRDCEGGAPVSLLDAQATGMPVISTKHCDIPSAVSDGESGILSPERDIRSLAESIKSFYRMDGTEFAIFSGKARAHVETHFDIERNARHVRKIYRDLITTKSD